MPDEPRFDPGDIATLAVPLLLQHTPRRTLVAPNRIAYQPMEANDGEADGAPSDLTFARYRARAAGRAGIDFVEALAVCSEGKARERQLMLAEKTRPGFERLVKEYRAINPDTPLVFQLTHSGRFSAEPVAAHPAKGESIRLLTDGDLLRIQADLVAATRLAFECGADGIDFKHCHGYLLGTILRPANLPRAGWTYGGETLEERARFCLETLALMMAAVPPDRFLYTVRLSAFEGVPGGFGSRGPTTADEDEACSELRAFSRMLESAGVALINQSAGVPELTPELVRQTKRKPLGFFAHQRYAARIKQAVAVPVVGSGYSYPRDGDNQLPGDDPAKKSLPALAAAAIRQGRTDLVGIGRQSLSDPQFAQKLLAGRFCDILWDDACSRCAIALRSGIPAGCVTHDPAAKERFREMRRRPRS